MSIEAEVSSYMESSQHAQQKRESTCGAVSSLEVTEMRTATLVLAANETGKPRFQKTIEGCQVERTCFYLLLLLILADLFKSVFCLHPDKIINY